MPPEPAAAERLSKQLVRRNSERLRPKAHFMEPDLFRFDDRYGYERKRANLFAWTIAILLLIGLALTAWLGSFYIFGQPERPDSYRILTKLHKIEAPKRFRLTAAPAGEFLGAKQLYDRYMALGPTDLTNTSAELTRNYVRNFQQVRGLVTYVVGRFNIMGSRELQPSDVFTSGVVALTRSVERPELLMEHIYTTADERDARLLKETLAMGLDIKLERAYDLSAVIHVERLPDGRIQITTIPLLYGSYAMTRGTGTFSLEPPIDLNLAAGWPIFKPQMRNVVEVNYERYREKLAPASGALSLAGIAPNAKTSPPPSADALVRVEPAMPLPAATPPARTSRGMEQAASLTRGGRTRKSKMAAATPTPSETIVAKRAVAVSAEEAAQAEIASAPNETSPPTASPTATITVLPAIPVATPSPGLALAPTAGANWKTFDPGEMPVGRLVSTSDLREIADRGTAGERIYLRGQFIVNFADGNRAVLRPKNKLTDTVLPSESGSRSTRIIVEYPAGSALPQPGSTVSRDDARPYEITEVRRQSDGQLNVFVREIIKQ
jgi:hypothetical protein